MGRLALLLELLTGQTTLRSECWEDWMVAGAGHCPVGRREAEEGAGGAGGGHVRDDLLTTPPGSPVRHVLTLLNEERRGCELSAARHCRRCWTNNKEEEARGRQRDRASKARSISVACTQTTTTTPSRATTCALAHPAQPSNNSFPARIHRRTQPYSMHPESIHRIHRAAHAFDPDIPDQVRVLTDVLDESASVLATSDDAR